MAEPTLKDIVPGKTYPESVEFAEEGGVVRFVMTSYFVGMYCAIYTPDSSQPCQTGDNDNKTFVRKLKKDIVKAGKRNVVVTIGKICNVVTD